MADLISAASLTELPGMLEESGIEPKAFLLRAGIPLDAVGVHDRFVPFTSLSTALGMAAAELGIADFALRLAARQHPDILGPLSIAARNSQTVGAALRSIAEHAHVYSPAMEIRLVSDGDTVAYEFHIMLRSVPARDHIVELALGVSLATFRMVVGRDFHPLRVTFEHPPLSERDVYVGHFSSPVEFSSGRSSLVFPNSLLSRRLPNVDRLAHDLAVRMMATTARRTRFADAVAAMIRNALPVGATVLPQIADLLAMHPRSVQRRLLAEGVSFEKLVDQVRHDIADGLLANPSIPVAMVARQLGYSEQSSLTRSCRRWFGMTPRDRRAVLTRAGEST